MYVEPPQRRIGARGVPLSADVDHIEVFVPILRDVVLSPSQVVAQQQVEDPRRLLCVLRQDADQPPRLRAHGGHPHHLGVVFAEALGAVDGELPALELLDDLGLLRVGVGEPRLVLAGDLIEGRLRDIDVALLNKRGAEPVDHGQNQRADLVAVDIGVGADDDLVPAEVLKVERGQVLRLLRLHLYAAAEHADKVGDDVGFENALVIGLQAVEDLAADGHDALKLRVARELDGAKGGIALDDIDLAL